MPIFRLIHCMLHATFLLKLQDPEKGRTGSFFSGGDFLRKLLYVVAKSAAQATRCRVMAAEDL